MFRVLGVGEKTPLVEVGPRWTPTVSLLHGLLDPADRVHLVHGDARRVKGHQRAAICTLLCKMTGRPVTRAVSSLPTLASNFDESGPLSQCNTICIEYQSFGFSLDTAGDSIITGA